MEAGSGDVAAVPDAAEEKTKEMSLFESQGKDLLAEAVKSSKNQPY